MLETIENKDVYVSEQSIESIRTYLLDKLGLFFSSKNEKDMIRNLKSASLEFGYTDINKFINWFLENGLPDLQLGVFSSFFTIGETYFFREKKSFDFLEFIYIPSIIQKRYSNSKHLRIWIAGCATGEESYSVAILLNRTIPNIKSWDISILATDINPLFLKKAKQGIYTKWSFRNNPSWFIEKYFIKVDESKFQIIPEIKEMVKFSSLNLAGNLYPSARSNTNNIDIIFCRNVMIYFSEKGIQKTTNNFYDSLVKGGVLIVSSSEMSNLIYHDFGKIFYSGLTIYQKGIEKGNGAKIDLTVSKTTEKANSIKCTNQINTKLNDRLSIETHIYPISAKDDLKEEKPIVSDYQIASDLLKKGLFEDAEKLLPDISLASSEDDPEVIVLLARTKANLGKLDEAKILCERALMVFKTDFSLYYLQATVLQDLGEEEGAVESLNKALYLQPDFVLAHFLLGNILMKTGKIFQGQKHLNNALKILSKQSPDELLPESDGLTVGKLTEIISAIRK